MGGPERNDAAHPVGEANGERTSVQHRGAAGEERHAILADGVEHRREVGGVAVEAVLPLTREPAAAPVVADDLERLREPFVAASHGGDVPLEGDVAHYGGIHRNDGGPLAQGPVGNADAVGGAAVLDGGRVHGGGSLVPSALPLPGSDPLSARCPGCFSGGRGPRSERDTGVAITRHGVVSPCSTA